MLFLSRFPKDGSGVTALDPQRAGFLGARYNNSQLIKLVLKLLFCEESILSLIATDNWPIIG